LDSIVLTGTDAAASRLLRKRLRDDSKTAEKERNCKYITEKAKNKLKKWGLGIDNYVGFFGEMCKYV